MEAKVHTGMHLCETSVNWNYPNTVYLAKFAQTADNWSLKKVQVSIIGTWC